MINLLGANDILFLIDEIEILWIWTYG